MPKAADGVEADRDQAEGSGEGDRDARGGPVAGVAGQLRSPFLDLEVKGFCLQYFGRGLWQGSSTLADAASESQLVIVGGKGGVAKTTTSASLPCSTLSRAMRSSSFPRIRPTLLEILSPRTSRRGACAAPRDRPACTPWRSTRRRPWRGLRLLSEAEPGESVGGGEGRHPPRTPRSIWETSFGRFRAAWGAARGPAPGDGRGNCGR